MPEYRSLRLERVIVIKHFVVAACQSAYYQQHGNCLVRLRPIRIPYYRVITSTPVRTWPTCWRRKNAEMRSVRVKKVVTVLLTETS